MTSPTIGMGGALHNGDLRSVEWYTPPHIFKALGLRFDLDPCAPEGGVPWIPADRHYSECGLLQPWEGRVWLNPPYGREASLWVDRLVGHGNGIALVFARVDAVWAQAAMRAADVVCLLAGRLSFMDGADRSDRKGHNAANGSMLLAYGNESAVAVRQAGLGITFKAER